MGVVSDHFWNLLVLRDYIVGSLADADYLAEYNHEVFLAWSAAARWWSYNPTHLIIHETLGVAKRRLL